MSIFKFNDNFISKQSQDEILLVNLDDPDDKVMSIKEVAIDFWAMINENKTEAEIIDKICQDYEVEASQVQKDLDQFIKSLYEKKILIKD